MKQTRQPEAVADLIHKFGIESYIDPVYPLCLGTSAFSLFELVGAYGTFANRGVHIDPIFVTRIEDRQGNVLANFAAPMQEAISEQTAYTMLDMLRRVVNAGTAGSIRRLGIKEADMGVRPELRRITPMRGLSGCCPSWSAVHGLVARTGVFTSRRAVRVRGSLCRSSRSLWNACMPIPNSGLRKRISFRFRSERCRMTAMKALKLRLLRPHPAKMSSLINLKSMRLILLIN